jgi:vacuolar-type H+-ATPase subunit I/STV1
MCYPTKEQYALWKERAEGMEMSVSKYMQAMVEAGWKKFDANIEPDETAHELRQQRNDLKRELERTRERVAMLEDQVHQGERAAIERYVRDNPGATYRDIVEYLGRTVAERATGYLDDLEGEQLRVEDGEYYPSRAG